MPSPFPASPAAQPDASDSLQQLANHCFGCGPSNPQGLHLQFALESSGSGAITSTATIQLTSLHQGRTGYVHGGIIATLLDEAMSKLNRPFAVAAMTRHMEIDYLRPVPLETPLKIVGHHQRRDGRKLFHTAEILGPDGKLLAKAKALFVVVDAAGISTAPSAGRA